MPAWIRTRLGNETQVRQVQLRVAQMELDNTIDMRKKALVAFYEQQVARALRERAWQRLARDLPADRLALIGAREIGLDEVITTAEDLAEIERAEIVVIEAYLPAKMGEAEIVAAIQAAIAETGASGPADMGKLMGALKPKLAGQADMGLVSKLVKQQLAG